MLQSNITINQPDTVRVVGDLIVATSSEGVFITSAIGRFADELRNMSSETLSPVPDWKYALGDMEIEVRPPLAEVRIEEVKDSTFGSPATEVHTPSAEVIVTPVVEMEKMEQKET